MSVRDRMDKWADLAIGIVSPRRRGLREHFRRMDSDSDYREVFLAAMSARGYRAAKGDSFNTPFTGTNRSADSEILGDLASLSSRSQELNRDDPLASGLTKTFVRNVIGTGMRAQARTKDDDKNKLLEAVWKKHRDGLAPADDMTHGEHQAMVFRKALEDGGVFVKKTKAGGEESVWFETIEKARVLNPPGGTPQTPRGSLRDGVDKDQWGRPTGYWVLNGYPSDIFTNVVARPGGMPTGVMTKENFSFAKKEMIKHLRLAERPGQTHGVPMFHAILQDLRDLDLLLLASLKRVQIAACLSVFIKSPKNLEDIMDTTARKYGYKLDQSLEPGMIFKLYPEEDVSTLIPNFPTPELEPFIIMLCRRIGAALGVSWQIVLKDFSASTYSSARTDLLEARQTYVYFQHWFIEKFLNWQWITVMEDARLNGELPGITPEEIEMVTWIPNGWRWVDPKKEAEGVQIELEIGITSLRDVCASQGKDWEEVMRQRLVEEKREKELRKELGVEEKEEKPDATNLPTDGGKVEAGGTEDGEGSQEPGGNGNGRGRPSRGNRLSKAGISGQR